MQTETPRESPNQKGQIRFLSFFIPHRIVIRVAMISSTLIIISLGLFVLATIPFQRTAILDAMESEAKSTVTSIDQVTASAIITEDFGSVVEHCLCMIRRAMLGCGLPALQCYPPFPGSAQVPHKTRDQDRGRQDQGWHRWCHRNAGR